MASPPSPAAAPSSAEARRAWSGLWATGVADTFGHPGDDSAPEPPLAAAWRLWFASLPPGGRMLDLASGNGALPRLMLSAGPIGLSCDAVDVADLSPRWLSLSTAAARERVRFHAGVACEHLPFPDCCFDIIASQFGIEYADIDAALREALRVIRPGGTMRFVLHAKQGRPATLAQEEIDHARWLHESGWLSAAGDMAEAMCLLNAPGGREALHTESRWQAVRHRFDTLQVHLAERSRGGICPDLLIDAQRWAAQVFKAAAAKGPAAAQAGMSEIRRLLGENETRLRDLLTHALTEEQMRAIAGRLAGQGRRTGLTPAQEQGHMMGWWLTVD